MPQHFSYAHTRSKKNLEAWRTLSPSLTLSFSGDRYCAQNSLSALVLRSGPPATGLTKPESPNSAKGECWEGCRGKEDFWGRVAEKGTAGGGRWEQCCFSAFQERGLTALLDPGNPLSNPLSNPSTLPRTPPRHFLGIRALSVPVAALITTLIKEIDAFLCNQG